jgi:hypothetical protein
MLLPLRNKELNQPRQLVPSLNPQLRPLRRIRKIRNQRKIRKIRKTRKTRKIRKLLQRASRRTRRSLNPRSRIRRRPSLLPLLRRRNLPQKTEMSMILSKIRLRSRPLLSQKRLRRTPLMSLRLMRAPQMKSDQTNMVII